MQKEEDIMSDHSLRAYLERRSTEELDAMLAYYLQDDRYKDYGYAILEILHVLEDRFVPDTSSEEYNYINEKLLQHKPKE